MKQSKPSKIIFNQLVATTLISSLLLTTACNSGKSTDDSKIVKKYIQEMKKQLTKIQEDLSKMQKAQNNSAEEENSKETQANLVTEGIEKEKKTQEQLEEEAATKYYKNYKLLQHDNNQSIESKEFTSVVAIGLSPKHKKHRTIIFSIDNITDSNGNIKNDVKASFLDVTNINGNINNNVKTSFIDVTDRKSHIKGSFFDYKFDIRSEIEVNEKSRQVRLNITRAENISNLGDDSSRIKEFKINLTAYSPDDGFNDIEQKISIPIYMDSRDMTISTSATDEQPCEDININGWNGTNGTLIPVVGGVVGGVVVAVVAFGRPHGAHLPGIQNHDAPQRPGIIKKLIGLIGIILPKRPQSPEEPGFRPMGPMESTESNPQALPKQVVDDRDEYLPPHMHVVRQQKPVEVDDEIVPKPTDDELRYYYRQQNLDDQERKSKLEFKKLHDDVELIIKRTEQTFKNYEQKHPNE